MKKLFFFVVAMVCAVGVYAQTDVTKFLGIPVDGFKDEMISKLKAKGFRSHEYDKEVLVGEFNGQNVTIFVHTNNNKVWRIAVLYVENCDETQTRTHFNNLCYQFENNPKYIQLKENQTINENENFGYEMLVNKKRYDAYFLQKPETLKYSRKLVWFTINRNIGKYNIILYYENGNNEAKGEDL